MPVEDSKTSIEDSNRMRRKTVFGHWSTTDGREGYHVAEECGGTGDVESVQTTPRIRISAYEELGGNDQ